LFSYHSVTLQQLRNNYEIYWYLQAELAYNRCFGETEIKIRSKLKKHKPKNTTFTQRRFLHDEVYGNKHFPAEQTD